MKKAVVFLLKMLFFSIVIASILGNIFYFMTSPKGLFFEVVSEPYITLIAFGLFGGLICAVPMGDGWNAGTVKKALKSNKKHERIQIRAGTESRVCRNRFFRKDYADVSVTSFRKYVPCKVFYRYRR